MKALSLLFLTMTWAVLTPGTDYAVPSSPASQQTSSANTAGGPPRDAGHAAPPRDGRHETGGEVSDEQPGHGRASGPNHPSSHAGLTRVNRPRQVPNGRQRPLPGNALSPPGWDRSGGAAKGGLIQNVPVHNASPVRTSSVVRPTALPINNARHRSPNPAVVGGSANSVRRNPAVINGTRMNRKRN
jgi:hypothetical protein